MNDFSAEGPMVTFRSDRKTPVEFNPQIESLVPIQTVLPPGVITADPAAREPMVEMKGAQAPLVPLLGYIRDSLAEHSKVPLTLDFAIRDRAQPDTMGVVKFDFSMPAPVSVPVSTLEMPDEATTPNPNIGIMQASIRSGTINSLEDLITNLVYYNISPDSLEGEYILGLFREQARSPILDKIASGEISTVADPLIKKALAQNHLDAEDIVYITNFLNDTIVANEQRAAQVAQIRLTLAQLLKADKAGTSQVFPKTFKGLTHITLFRDRNLDDALEHMGQEELLDVSRKLFWEALGLYDEYKIAKKMSSDDKSDQNFRDILGLDTNIVVVEHQVRNGESLLLVEASDGSIRFICPPVHIGHSLYTSGTINEKYVDFSIISDDNAEPRDWASFEGGYYAEGYIVGEVVGRGAQIWSILQSFLSAGLPINYKLHYEYLDDIIDAEANANFRLPEGVKLIVKLVSKEGQY